MLAGGLYFSRRKRKRHRESRVYDVEGSSRCLVRRILRATRPVLNFLHGRQSQRPAEPDLGLADRACQDVSPTAAAWNRSGPGSPLCQVAGSASMLQNCGNPGQKRQQGTTSLPVTHYCWVSRHTGGAHQPPATGSLLVIPTSSKCPAEENESSNRPSRCLVPKQTPGGRRVRRN